MYVGHFDAMVNGIRHMLMFTVVTNLIWSYICSMTLNTYMYIIGAPKYEVESIRTHFAEYK